jgi:hypothetical protein
MHFIWTIFSYGNSHAKTACGPDGLGSQRKLEAPVYTRVLMIWRLLV